MARKARRKGTGGGCLVLRGNTWFARWTIGGKTYTRTTGTSSQRAAEEKLAEFTAPFRLGSEVEALQAIASRIEGRKAQIEDWKDSQPAMTLLQAWQAFKLKPKGKTPRGRVIMPGERTLADYEGRWNAFCTWMEKNYPKNDKDGNRVPWELRQIGKEHAERYIAEIGAGRSANTRNKSLTFLRLVFKVMADDARIQNNPFDGMDAAAAAVIRKRPLTLAELAAVSKNLEGAGEMETLFAFGYYTGARLGDCVLMRWDSIDMGGRKIRYTPSKTAKGNREITLTLAPALYALLDKMPQKARRGLILPELGELYQNDPAAVSKRVQKVFEDSEIETTLKVKGYKKNVTRVGFHSLRHAHITALLEGGVPMDMVRQQAGHSTIGMTAHYYHASNKALKAATDALPDMAGGNSLPEPADAPGARFEGVFSKLDSFTAEQLERLAEKAREIAGGRKSASPLQHQNQFAGAAGAAAG